MNENSEQGCIHSKGERQHIIFNVKQGRQGKKKHIFTYSVMKLSENKLLWQVLPSLVSFIIPKKKPFFFRLKIQCHTLLSYQNQLLTSTTKFNPIKKIFNESHLSPFKLKIRTIERQRRLFCLFESQLVLISNYNENNLTNIRCLYRTELHTTLYSYNSILIIELFFFIK